VEVVVVVVVVVVVEKERGSVDKEGSDDVLLVTVEVVLLECKGRRREEAEGDIER
jgi:hypothetical protein